jgi:hypothetical protein
MDLIQRGGNLYPDDIRPTGRPLSALPNDPAYKDRPTAFQFYLPYRQNAELRQICHELNVTMSWAIRQGIEWFIRQHREEQTNTNESN